MARTASLVPKGLGSRIHPDHIGQSWFYTIIMNVGPVDTKRISITSGRKISATHYYLRPNLLLAIEITPVSSESFSGKSQNSFSAASLDFGAHSYHFFLISTQTQWHREPIDANDLPFRSKDFQTGNAKQPPYLRTSQQNFSYLPLSSALW